MTLLLTREYHSPRIHPPTAGQRPSLESAKVKELPIVPSVEYANWSQFPVGATITHVRETKSEVDKVIVTTISRLAEKSTEKVVIETQITVDRGSEPLINPPMRTEFAASFRLPPNMEASVLALPAQNARASGMESIHFSGIDFQATIYSWIGSSEAGPTTNTMWLSNEIPGRVLRHTMTCSGFTSLEQISKLEIPAP